MSLRAGASLGRYVIESPLGAGGMGDVYLAEDAGRMRSPQTTARGAPCRLVPFDGSSAGRQEDRKH